MEDIKVINTESELVAIGRLVPLQDFKPRPKQTIGLPREISVLTCAIGPTEGYCLSRKPGEASFGFGHIELDDGPLMSIRFQLDDLQVYWVAQLTDPEIWAAIDVWKRAGRVPILFDVEEANRRHQMVCVIDLPSDTSRHDLHRLRPDRAPTGRTWQSMVSLAASGQLQMQATTDLQGIPLRHVLANVLLTKRLEKAVPTGDWHSRR